MTRRTKIVATLGPATAQPSTLTALLDAGVNVVRINSSHGTPELRASWLGMVRQASEGREQPVAILVDLQGPRIRVGELPSPR
ncbi:MAG: pyruvate kinase, partial [Gemmatimonadota bacterium]